MTWNKGSGDWDINGSLLRQNSTEGLARCYTHIESGEFIATFRVTLLDPKNDKTGEAKFFFSNAHEGEEFRIDFLYSPGACRIYTRGWNYPVPFSLVRGKQHSVRVVVNSNLMSVSVDGLSILKGYQFGQVSDGNVGIGTWEASAEFEDIHIHKLKEKRCFIIMPFDEKRNLVYEQAIKPSLESHPSILFYVERADESITVGKISEEIVHSISQADVVVADISEVNANVYYELGYSHALGKNAVLLFQCPTEGNVDIPFDIRDFRHHRYKFSDQGLHDLRARMTELMTKIVGTEA